jgi:hypothetical protein
MASPYFKMLLSTPSVDEVVDGLPVIRVSEDAQVLNSLLSLLYPVLPVMPSSNDQGFSLLATCQKYEMASIKPPIHLSCGPFGTDPFRAYAIASREKLTGEMERAAGYTLEHPMTFETLGKGLRLFEGWALRDLVRFRKRCRDNVVAFLEPYLEDRAGPSKIWAGCPDSTCHRSSGDATESMKDVLPRWLCEFLTRNKDKIQQGFMHEICLSSIEKELLRALRAHADCDFCLRVHISEEGSEFKDVLYWGILSACYKVGVLLATAQGIIHGFQLAYVLGIGNEQSRIRPDAWLETDQIRIYVETMSCVQMFPASADATQLG